MDRSAIILEGVPQTAGKKGRRRVSSEEWFGYLFISPMVAGYVFFLLGPIVTAFVMSFTNWSLLKEFKFVGLFNYNRAFFEDSLFWESVTNTLIFSAGFVPLDLSLALLLAIMLRRKWPGIVFFRTAIFSPVVVSIVVWAIVWKYIFATDHGIVNQLLQFAGIEGPAWLYNEQLTMGVIIFVSVLKNVGLKMVIFLAALNDIPQMYYEAARIDGASGWRSFRHITLPLITPSIFLAAVITIIGSLKIFGQIFVMTKGGPGTSTYVIVYYIYETAFKMYDFGYASAIAVVLFILTLALTLVQWHARKRWIHYEQ
jgi:multiple sugar transport system permease protein